MSSDDYYNTDDHNTAREVEVESADEDFAVDKKVDHHEHEHDHDHDHDGHGHDNLGHDNHDLDEEEGDDDVVIRDVIMWRRSKIGVVVMAVTTLVWVLLQVYGFNFVPLACWTLMAAAVLLFPYGSFLRLLSKEAPHMTNFEITEQSATEIGESAKRMMEKGIRWMFYVSCEREWYFFVGVIATLFLLAYVGCYIDLITLLYTGTMVGMTVPVMYVKKEDAIKAYAKKVEEKGKSMYHKVNDKVFSKSKLQKKEKKEE